MSNIQKLKDFIAAVDYPINIEVIEDFWFRDGDCITWNTAGNLEDLQQGDGFTYSAETKCCGTEFEGYLVVNADNGCGDSITYVLDLDKELNFE